MTLIYRAWKHTGLLIIYIWKALLILFHKIIYIIFNCMHVYVCVSLSVCVRGTYI